MFTRVGRGVLEQQRRSLKLLSPRPRKTETECLRTLSQNKRASVHSPGDARLRGLTSAYVALHHSAWSLLRVAKAPLACCPGAAAEPKMSLCERTHSTRLDPAQNYSNQPPYCMFQSLVPIILCASCQKPPCQPSHVVFLDLVVMCVVTS